MSPIKIPFTIELGLCHNECSEEKQARCGSVEDGNDLPQQQTKTVLRAGFLVCCSCDDEFPHAKGDRVVLSDIIEWSSLGSFSKEYNRLNLNLQFNGILKS